MILAAGAVMAVAPAFAAVRRVVVVNRPYVGGFYGAGFYGPGYWGPYWGPGYYAPYGVAYANTGEVKIDTKAKEAEVFVNGSFAGTVKDVHSMHLRPGNYTIEVRYPGAAPGFSERVYVVAGKTLHLHPAL
jgi:hypothetical protein